MRLQSSGTEMSEPSLIRQLHLDCCRFAKAAELTLKPELKPLIIHRDTVPLISGVFAVNSLGLPAFEIGRAHV